MAFAYKELTISGGSDPALEGTSKFLQDIKDCLVNDMGWTLTEDRSDQAGTDHQIILQSNGEDDTASTFYLVLTSGTTDNIGCQVASYWDTGTHTTGSGLGVPSDITSSTLLTDSNGDFTGWISGNKDSVIIISSVASVYDGNYLGRISQFTDPNIDHFPVYCIGSSSANLDILSIASSSIYTLIDATSDIPHNDSQWEAFFTSPISTDQHPTNIFGYSEAYVGSPVFATMDDFSPVRRSIRGVALNLWVTIGPNAAGSTAALEDELVAGDGKVYKLFANSLSSGRFVVIRKS